MREGVWQSLRGGLCGLTRLGGCGGGVGGVEGLFGDFISLARCSLLAQG